MILNLNCYTPVALSIPFFFGEAALPLAVAFLVAVDVFFVPPEMVGAVVDAIMSPSELKVFVLTRNEGGGSKHRGIS